jgi:Domain of unknown function (DUF4936)
VSGAPGPLAYYVYYRIPGDAQASARDLAAAVLAGVERRSGVRGRIARRRDDPLTWMEIYEGVVDAAAFERALDEAEADWPSTCARHRECFTPW